jgi:hypothetical protein
MKNEGYESDAHISDDLIPKNQRASRDDWLRDNS